MRKTFVAVIGGGEASPEDIALAYEVGRELARRGVILVCGGLGGVMEAACKGAKEAGGLTIGILPGHRREEANPFVDIPIATGIGYARNAAVVQSAQAVIAVDGSFGTLSEIGHALQHGTPVVGLKTWNLCQGDGQPAPVISAETPVEAVDKALMAMGKKAKARS